MPSKVTKTNPHKRLKILIGILLGSIIILGSILVSIQLNKRYAVSLKKPAEPQLAIKDSQLESKISSSTYDTVSLDINTWSTFTNSKLGFSFKYPSEWGEVKEKIDDANNEKSGTTGKTYTLTFSDIDYASLNLDNHVIGSGRSPDYSAGRGGTDTDYYGESTKRISATVWARPENCIIPISSHLYFGRIDFSLPGKEISGVRLLMPVISQKQKEILDREYDTLTQKEQEKYCTSENIEREATRFINDMKTQQLDQLSNKQLSVFKQILDSSRLL